MCSFLGNSEKNYIPGYSTVIGLVDNCAILNPTHLKCIVFHMVCIEQTRLFAMHTANHSRSGTGYHEAQGLPSMFQASLPTTLFSAHRPVVIPCLSTLYYGRIIIYNGTICSLPSLSMGQIAFTGS